MLCPNCKQPLQRSTLDKQKILHCTDCGCTFFEENGINRISSSNAGLLAANKRADEISGAEKLCPKDNLPLEEITQDAAIPDGVTLLRCPRCFGVLTYPADLLLFKNAQDTKIGRFKKAQRPLPALSAIIVLVFLAAASFSVVTSLNKKQLSSVKATDLVKYIDVSTSSPTTIITVTTSKPVQSIIRLHDRTTGQRIQRPTSKGLSTVHLFSSGNIRRENDVYFKLLFFDAKGHKISETEEKKLEDSSRTR